jgi:hypothetical protein
MQGRLHLENELLKRSWIRLRDHLTASGISVRAILPFGRSLKATNARAFFSWRSWRCNPFLLQNTQQQLRQQLIESFVR